MLGARGSQISFEDLRDKFCKFVNRSGAVDGRAKIENTGSMHCYNVDVTLLCSLRAEIQTINGLIFYTYFITIHYSIFSIKLENSFRCCQKLRLFFTK